MSYPRKLPGFGEVKIYHADKAEVVRLREAEPDQQKMVLAGRST